MFSFMLLTMGHQKNNNNNRKTQKYSIKLVAGILALYGEIWLNIVYVNKIIKFIKLKNIYHLTYTVYFPCLTSTQMIEFY